MSKCPLNGFEECIGKECEWYIVYWVGPNNGKTVYNCSIRATAELLWNNCNNNECCF
ncbi:Uncharacterised protein [uncultured archaeon]|nr:Uncharacterised protein [uncultured archaeon]